MQYTDSILERVSPFGAAPPKEVVKMAVSKAQQKAVAKYEAKAYDKVLLRLPKGRLDEIKDHTTAHGESVNGFIGRAISETMERDGSGMTSSGPQEAAGMPPGSGVVSLPSETVKAAREAAQAEGEAVSQFIARAVETQAQRDTLARKLKGRR